MTFQLPPLHQLGFGLHFCPVMISSVFQKGKWSPLKIGPAELQLHPAAKSLHYAQEIFEGLKVFQTSPGKAHVFRPEKNIQRMTRSARIMAMPPFPEDKFLEAIFELSRNCSEWIPEEPGALYLRPTMIASSAALGVAPSLDYLFYIIASPVGGYFGSVKSDKPASISVDISTDHVRAVRGGIGAAKTGANYAASLRAVAKAKEAGFDNVLFLDALERSNLEELSGMNIFVVEGGILKTPKLGDTILDGVTRDSILTLAKTMKIPTSEENIPLTRVLKGLESPDKNQKITEILACGTGASITAICELGYQGKRIKVAGGSPGPLTSQLYKELLEIQFGRKNPPKESWTLKI